jgi:hypothetical protein
MVLNYRMRFYLVLFFCGLSFLLSCSDNKSVPGDVIKQHQMALLLTDIHLVDGTVYNLPSIPDTLAKHGLGLYLAVFKMHHTDTAEFKKSLQFYSTRPDLLVDIYTGVVDRLDSLQKARAKAAAAIKPVIPKASQKTTAQMADSVKKAQAKTDSIKTANDKRKADSARVAKLRIKMVVDVNKKAKAVRDSIRKAKKLHKKHKKTDTTNVVPN